jgi:hypothetical protein
MVVLYNSECILLIFVSQTNLRYLICDNDQCLNLFVHLELTILGHVLQGDLNNLRKVRFMRNEIFLAD